MIATVLLSSLVTLSPALQDRPDLLVLQDGKEIECRVLYEDDEVVVYRDRKKREIPRAEVAEIQSIERSLLRFFERFERLAPDDVAGMAELATWCEGRELPGEAHNMWIRILTLDPENEEAWTKLGGSKGRKGWRLKVRGRFYTLDQLRDRVSDWKNAMELRTAHFLLRTDVAPERALDLTIDLERAYIQFYEILGQALGLYVFDMVPEVHVCSDPKDYREPPTPRDAWFAFVPNTLYVRGTEDRNRQEIISNFTYLLLFNALNRTLGRNGQVAPWARRGLAEAFGAAARVDPGRTRWEMEEPFLPYFEMHARDDEPLSLEEVVRAGLLSFDSGPSQHRYVAQSYTLMYFLAFGAERKYGDRFAEYVKSSFLDKGSVQDLERILSVDLEELAAEWTTFVQEVAGV